MHMTQATLSFFAGRRKMGLAEPLIDSWKSSGKLKVGQNKVENSYTELSHISKQLPNLRENVLRHLIIKDLLKILPLARQGPQERLHVLLDILVHHLHATLDPHEPGKHCTSGWKEKNES